MQVSTTSQLHSLYIPQEGRSDEISDLHKTLPAKGKLVLGDISGAGVIGQIYLTHWNHTDEGRILAGRGVILRCFWDGEKTPSVEVPLNDFFGIGFGKDRRLNSMVWQRDGTYHMHFSLPMAFRKRAVVELENLTDKDLHGFYWGIEYDRDISLPKDIEYFHAQYRQSHPVPKNASHTVLDAKGHGKYVGTIWSVNWLNAGCPPENAFNFFIDGGAVHGQNSEDYFGQSWGFKSGVFNMLCVGQSLEMEKTDIGSTQMTSYRAHLPNPLLFQESLRFTMDNQAYNRGYHSDSYDTVAFWYQSHPHLPFPPLPPLEELLPIQYAKSYSRGLWEIYSAEKTRDFGKALSKAQELIQNYPSNLKTPDVLYKIASIHEESGNRSEAPENYRQIIREWPKSEAAADAKDKLWLQEKPGRLLMTLVTPSGWTAYLDGKEIIPPSSIFQEIPSWGEKKHHRYGRSQCLRLSQKDGAQFQANLPPGAAIPIIVNPYSSTVFDTEENIVQWNDSSSSIMRLFTLRLEPGAGEHLLAVAATVSNDIPIRLESQMPGGMICVLDNGVRKLITDGTWRVSDNPGVNWQQPSTSDETWDEATVYPNEQYGDTAWFWLYPGGFRKFPGYFTRIWGKTLLGANRSLCFRKKFYIGLEK
jgi:tetratricopeptide (TPR) repeat protein